MGGDGGELEIKIQYVILFYGNRENESFYPENDIKNG